MPSREESKKWKVVAFPLYSERKVLRLLNRIKPLRDVRGEISPAQWWAGGHFTHPARPKVVVLVLKPGKPVNLERLVFRAAGVLAENSGKTLDWAWGERGGRVYLVVKTLAKDRETGRNVLFRLGRKTLGELVDLVPGKPRGRERELRGRERERR